MKKKTIKTTLLQPSSPLFSARERFPLTSCSGLSRHLPGFLHQENRLPQYSGLRLRLQQPGATTGVCISSQPSRQNSWARGSDLRSCKLETRESMNKSSLKHIAWNLCYGRACAGTVPLANCGPTPRALPLVKAPAAVRNLAPLAVSAPFRWNQQPGLFVASNGTPVPGKIARTEVQAIIRLFN